MHDRHDPLLLTLLTAMRPARVLEVAGPESSRAELVLSTMDKCVMVSVGAPERITELRERYGARVEVREGPPLRVLAALDEVPDVALLTVEPSSYTLVHLLRSLARTAAGAPFPSTFVCQARGRPNVDTLAACRAPGAECAFLPGKTELDASDVEGDTRDTVARHDGKNGVLTAIKDFQSESGLPLERVVVSAFGGVCVLVDRRRLDANASLAELFNELAAPSPVFAGLVESLERLRIHRELALLERAAELARCESDRARLVDEVAYLRGRVAEKTREIERATSQMNAKSIRIVELEATKSTFEALLTSAEKRVAGALARCADLQAEVASVRAELEGERRRAQSALTRAAQLELRLSERVAGIGSRSEASSAAAGPDPSPSERAGFLEHSASTLFAPASLELARRRLNKFRRDPRLFLAHSRFGLARKLARIL